MLRAYTQPINLEAFDEQKWMTNASGVDAVGATLKSAELSALISAEQGAYLPPMDERSFQAGMLGSNPEGGI